MIGRAQLWYFPHIRVTKKDYIFSFFSSQEFYLLACSENQNCHYIFCWILDFLFRLLNGDIVLFSRKWPSTVLNENMRNRIFKIPSHFMKKRNCSDSFRPNKMTLTLISSLLKILSKNNAIFYDYFFAKILQKSLLAPLNIDVNIRKKMIFTFGRIHSGKWHRLWGSSAKMICFCGREVFPKCMSHEGELLLLMGFVDSRYRESTKCKW